MRECLFVVCVCLHITEEVVFSKKRRKIVVHEFKCKHGNISITRNTDAMIFCCLCSFNGNDE